MLLGAHMSIAGGLHRAVERAESVGCESLQVFLKNSNQWRARALTEEEVARFREAWRASGVRRVIAHNAYLINLCSPDAATAHQSFDAMLDELSRATALGIEGVVMHPGAHKGAGEAHGMACIAEAVNELIARTPASKVQDARSVLEAALLRDSIAFAEKPGLSLRQD